MAVAIKLSNGIDIICESSRLEGNDYVVVEPLVPQFAQEGLMLVPFAMFNKDQRSVKINKDHVTYAQDADDNISQHHKNTIEKLRAKRTGLILPKSLTP